MQDVKYIVIHCSDSPNSLSDKRFDTAGDIHRWHKARGFDGIGYHYVVDESGDEQAGRPVFLKEKGFWKGAHCVGHNSHSIGICLIGKKDFHGAQLNQVRQIIKRLLAVWPNAKVVGHRDVDSRKTCPNFDVGYWLETGEQLN